MEKTNISIKFVNSISIDGAFSVVDMETAKHIKELGFKEPTHYFWLCKDVPYVKMGLKRVDRGKRRMNHNKYAEFIYSAPTKSEVNKWLGKRKV